MKLKRIVLFTSFLLLIAVQCFSATYTCTQDGNWNTDATWGGGGHPSANDDVVTINNASYDVVYDAGDSAVTWGNVSVTAGSLSFPVNANSTMSFNATGVLAIGATGILNIGTSTSSPIGAAYHCKIYWPQGAATRNVFTVVSGGTVNVYGDPAFYGSAPTADLNSDWSSGQTLYVTGDYTALWSAGQKFWIHKNSYATWSTDSAIFTIASIGAYDAGNNRTPITITEAAPGVLYDAINATSGWQSKLLMISRNVELADPGAAAGVNGYSSYTERIRTSFSQNSNTFAINFNNCMWQGWDYAILGCNNIFDGVVILNNALFVTAGAGTLIVKNSVICSNSTVFNSGHGSDVTNTYIVANGTKKS